MLGDASFAESLEEKTRKHFYLKSLRRAARDEHERTVEGLKRRLENGEIGPDEYAEGLANATEKLLLKRFRERFVPIHRKLARSIGFVAPYQGPSQRFVLGDNLLKALVLANVAPGERPRYDELLSRLYRRYGIIVDQRAARESSLYDLKPVNAEYFDDNRDALQQKLKTASLLEEYSDATALVVNEWRKRGAKESDR